MCNDGNYALLQSRDAGAVAVVVSSLAAADAARAVA